VEHGEGWAAARTGFDLPGSRWVAKWTDHSLRFVVNSSYKHRPIRFDTHNHFVYALAMIRSFADKETEAFYETGKSRRLPVDIQKRAAMRLTQLNAAVRVEDLRLPPSNRLEALHGERDGQWSIRINEQWRVCFRFEDGNEFDVEIVDYH
jgi:proteic killer suppression protein